MDNSLGTSLDNLDRMSEFTLMILIFQIFLDELVYLILWELDPIQFDHGNFLHLDETERLNPRSIFPSLSDNQPGPPINPSTLGAIPKSFQRPRSIEERAQYSDGELDTSLDTIRRREDRLKQEERQRRELEFRNDIEFAEELYLQEVIEFSRKMAEKKQKGWFLNLA